MQKSLVILTTLALLVSILLAGCGSEKDKGSLTFYANGEDFARQGLVSKDGWNVSFEHIYVTLADVRAYQTDPPYDAHQGGDVKAKETVKLDQTYTVDLAKGGSDAPPILVDQVSDAPVGHYNATHWKMALAKDGPAAGHSLLITGSAEKDGETVAFTLRVEQEYTYTCGEYVGDQRKGYVQKDGAADLEMTFHLDHIFGDAGSPLDDDLNLDALGFDTLATAPTIDMNMSQLKEALSAQEYQALTGAILTLGHVGEGHCHCEGE